MAENKNKSLIFDDTTDHLLFEAIRHENLLIDHRVRWFTTTQGLFFAGTAALWEKLDGSRLVPAACILSILICISSAFILYTGAEHIQRLQLAARRADVRGRTGRVANSEPTLEGGDVVSIAGNNLGALRFLSPWYTFPFIFIVLWGCVLYTKQCS